MAVGACSDAVARGSRARANADAHAHTMAHPIELWLNPMASWYC